METTACYAYKIPVYITARKGACARSGKVQDGQFARWWTSHRGRRKGRAFRVSALAQSESSPPVLRQRENENRPWSSSYSLQVRVGSSRALRWTCRGLRWAMGEGHAHLHSPHKSECVHMFAAPTGLAWPCAAGARSHFRLSVTDQAAQISCMNAKVLPLCEWNSHHTTTTGVPHSSTIRYGLLAAHCLVIDSLLGARDR